MELQPSLESMLRPRGRGGKRPGAGRKRTRTTVAHTARESFSPRDPIHSTLRLVPGVQLRTPALLAIVHAVIARSHGADFRIVEFNCEPNHMHVMAEASGRVALARGMQRFKSVLARRINQALGRRGALFADRYHAHVLRSLREVRHALRYILNNARHHAAERGRALDPRWFDPFSSAAWFDGWTAPLAPYSSWTYELMRRPAPTARATVWVLTTGWRRHGLIDPAEVPGPARRKPRG